MDPITHFLTDGLNLGSFAVWKLFDLRLEELLRTQRLVRLPARKRPFRYVGEKWYHAPSNGKTYVYVPVEEKIWPSWTEESYDAVPLNERSGPSTASGMRAMQTGVIPANAMQGTRQYFKMHVASGMLEPFAVPSANPDESWFRDPTNGDLYRLLDNQELGIFRLDRNPPEGAQLFRH